MLLGEIQPKWVLLADPMADISLTTSADVRSDAMFFREITAWGRLEEAQINRYPDMPYGFMFFGM